MGKENVQMMNKKKMMMEWRVDVFFSFSVLEGAEGRKGNRGKQLEETDKGFGIGIKKKKDPREKGCKRYRTGLGRSDQIRCKVRKKNGKVGN